MIQRLLRGKLLYLMLGVLVVVLYGRVLSVRPTRHVEPLPQQTSDTLEWWPQNLDPSTLSQKLLHEPRLLVALGLLSLVTAGMWVGGMALAGWGLVSGQVRSVWQFPSRRLPPWTLGEFGRIALLVSLIGSLMPFVRLAIAALQPGWDLDLHLWMTAAMLFLDLFVILTIVTFAVGRGSSVWSALGLSARNVPEALRVGLRGYVALFPWLVLSLLLVVELARLVGLKPPLEPIHELLFEEHRPSVLRLTILLACVVGPLAEELFFRGLLYPAIRRRLSRWSAMFLSGGLFALIHMNAVGFLPILLLGAFLAYLYERTGSLASSMIVHVLHNTLLMGMALVFRQLMPGI